MSKSVNLQLVDLLPDDMIWEIYQYLPVSIKAFLNKENYCLYHSFIKPRIFHFENYVRDTIRRDSPFVFTFVLEENGKKWLTNKKYYYKNKIFANYLYFIIDFCTENLSDKCRFVLESYLNRFGLCKNGHKKNIIQTVRWRK
uniref:Uncharacterized protein n=1 Tax=viral metagenome TaxID=1070528 RepID=A0A6C0LJV1_9ZZZZ